MKYTILILFSMRVIAQDCRHIEVTCRDSYGDGWQGAYLTINDVRYCEGFSSGYSESETHEVCGNTITVMLRTFSWASEITWTAASTDWQCNSLPVGSYPDDEAISVECPAPGIPHEPTPSPTFSSTPRRRSPTSSPTQNPTPLPTPIPTPSPTPSPTLSPTLSPTPSPTPTPTLSLIQIDCRHIEVTCRDSYGDGWQGAYLTINDVRYCEGFSSGFSESETHEVCGNTITVMLRTLSWASEITWTAASTDWQCNSLPVGSYPDYEAISVECPAPGISPTPSPTSSPTQSPTPFPTPIPTPSPIPSPTVSPTLSPTPSPGMRNCPNGPITSPCICSTTPSPTSAFDSCNESMSGQLSSSWRGYGYRGCQTTTRSGLQCQAWNSQSPHSHINTPENNPDAGLEANFCRNPDDGYTIWCYTESASKRWDYCDPMEIVPSGCTVHYDHKWSPLDYGERTVTATGALCAERCSALPGCGGASWVSDGGCHVSGENSELIASNGITAYSCIVVRYGGSCMNGEYQEPAWRLKSDKYCLGETWANRDNNPEIRFTSLQACKINCIGDPECLACNWLCNVQIAIKIRLNELVYGTTDCWEKRSVCGSYIHYINRLCEDGDIFTPCTCGDGIKTFGICEGNLWRDSQDCSNGVISFPCYCENELRYGGRCINNGAVYVRPNWLTVPGKYCDSDLMWPLNTIAERPDVRHESLEECRAVCTRDPDCLACNWHCGLDVYARIPTSQKVGETSRCREKHSACGSTIYYIQREEPVPLIDTIEGFCGGTDNATECEDENVATCEFVNGRCVPLENASLDYVCRLLNQQACVLMSFCHVVGVAGCEEKPNPCAPYGGTLFVNNDGREACCDLTCGSYCGSSDCDLGVGNCCIGETICRHGETNAPCYKQGAYTVPAGVCNSEDNVLEEEQCQSVQMILDLDIEITWVGSDENVPRGCSLRMSNKQAHFNRSPTGRADPDLMAVCLPSHKCSSKGFQGAAGEVAGCCTAQEPCPEGVGDCNGDGDCQASLACKPNVGQEYGYLGEDIDICVNPNHRCAPNGKSDGPGESSGCCTSSRPCPRGIGDCNHNIDCEGDLVCIENTGNYYGYIHDDIDVCDRQDHPCKATGSPDGPGEVEGCCSPDDNCPAGHGDCNTDADCGGFLMCEEDVGSQYGYHSPLVDVCTQHPCAPGSINGPGEAEGCCTPEMPCPENFGDCNTNDDCFDDLVCVNGRARDYGYHNSNNAVCLSPDLVPVCPSGHITSGCLCGGYMQVAFTGSCDDDTFVQFDSAIGIWETFDEGGKKCADVSTAEHGVANQAECRVEADEDGYMFYNYERNSRTCFQSTTCYSVISSDEQWQIYKKRPSDDGGYDQVSHLTEIDAAFDLFEQIKLMSAILDFIHAGYWQRRVEACRYIERSWAGQQMKRIALATGTCIAISSAIDTTVLFVMYEVGVSFIWGEKGQFACADNQSLGVNLGLLGIGASVGMALSPALTLGGWSNVSADWTDYVTCYSIGVSNIVGIALTITINHALFEANLQDALDLLLILFNGAMDLIFSVFGGFDDWIEVRTTLLNELLKGVHKFGVTDVGVSFSIGFDVLDIIDLGIPFDADATVCTERLVYCVGEDCAGKAMASWWSDGTLCGIGTTCRNCYNEYTYWYGKAMTACGLEPTWPDGTDCLAGTTCNNCSNGYSYWWGKAFTACGYESSWPDGTICLLGTSCKQCLNTATFWNGPFTFACGIESCWPTGTTCFSGTCASCCGGSHGEWYEFGVRKCL